MKILDTKEQAKQAAGNAAAQCIQDGMVVGLGSGTTATYFIESLIKRYQQEHLKITVVPTSEHSAKQAVEGGIPLCDINQIFHLDVTVDGADEIDHQKRMIKGGGGALLREKIIASLSREVIVIIDNEKVVKHLGAFPLPIEVLPFAHQATLQRIGELGYKGAFRQTNGELYLTDNGNYIIDISFPKLYKKPENDNAILRSIPGIIETGFFFNLAKKVFVGYPDGTVKSIT